MEKGWTGGSGSRQLLELNGVKDHLGWTSNMCGYNLGSTSEASAQCGYQNSMVISGAEGSRPRILTSISSRMWERNQWVANWYINCMTMILTV